MADTPAYTEIDDADAQRALAILLDVGTAIILELKAPTTDATPIARAAAYHRVADAVRHTILLARHIADAAPARERRQAKENAARRHVIRAVQDSIERNARPATADALRLELLERIDDPEFAIDLATRSPADIIAELCRDLGLDALPGLRPLRRTPDDIAILCAQAAAAPGSGLPQWIAATAEQAAKNDAAAPPTIRLKES